MVLAPKEVERKEGALVQESGVAENREIWETDSWPKMYGTKSETDKYIQICGYTRRKHKSRAEQSSKCADISGTINEGV